MIAVELARQWRRPRSRVVVLILVVIPALITLALHASHEHGRGGGFFEVARQSGLNSSIAILQFTSAFFLVVVASLFAGDAIASEASWGTLRYLLVRPVTRARLLAAKFAVAALAALVTVLVMTGAALVAGIVAFGWHPVITPNLRVLSAAAATWRLLGAALYVTANLLGIGAMAFFLSTVTDTPAGPIGAGIGIAILSQILDGIPGVGIVRNGLPTHYWDAWRRLFIPGFPLGDIGRGLLVDLGYLVAFLALSAWWFARKDVLS